MDAQQNRCSGLSVHTRRGTLALEARLGIFVITILVFAFGFIVFRKLDQHQHQQLASASIPPQGTLPGPADVSGFLPPNSGTSDAAAPFADHREAFTRLTESDVTATAGESPETDPQQEWFPSSLVPLAEPEPGPAFDADPDEAAVANTEPGETFATADADQFVSATTEAPPDFDTIVVDANALATADENPFPEAETAATAEAAGTVETAVEPEAFDAVAFDSPQHETPLQIAPAPESSEMQTDNRPAPARVAADDRDWAAATERGDSGLSVPLTVPSQNASLERIEEPMLLAMNGPASAEPQQESAVEWPPVPSPGDARPLPAPVQTPVEELPQLPFDSATETDAADSTAAPATTPPQTPFDAEPPSQPDGLDIPSRTAAAHSTSRQAATSQAPEGQFSVTAFRYQNGVSSMQGDGETFEVVTVGDGENYWAISKRVYGTSRYFSALALFNQNRIPDPRRMRPGMKVLVPPEEALEQMYPELFRDQQPRRVQPASFLTLDDGSPAYRVGQAETLSDISQRLLGRSSRWIEIYRLNQHILKDPNKLKPGTILALPEDAVQVRVTP